MVSRLLSCLVKQYSRFCGVCVTAGVGCIVPICCCDPQPSLITAADAVFCLLQWTRCTKPSKHNSTASKHVLTVKTQYFKHGRSNTAPNVTLHG